jgi:hypothetical protein
MNWDEMVVDLLKLPLHKGQDDESIALRFKILDKAFASAAPWVAAAVLSRLEQRLPTDQFSELFHQKLASVPDVRANLIQYLRVRAGQKGKRPEPAPKITIITLPRQAPSPETPLLPEREKRPSLWRLLLDQTIDSVKDDVRNPQYIPGKMILGYIPPAALALVERNSVMAEIWLGTYDLSYLTASNEGCDAYFRFQNRTARRIGAAQRHINHTFVQPLVAAGGGPAGLTLSRFIRTRPRLRPGGNGGDGGGGRRALPPGDGSGGPITRPDRLLGPSTSPDPDRLDWALKAITDWRKTLSDKHVQRNVAVSRLEIDGELPTDRLFAISGTKNPPGALPKKPVRTLVDPADRRSRTNPPANAQNPTHVVGTRHHNHERGHDSEVQLLELAEKDLTKLGNRKARLWIYSERIPCPACQRRIRQFQEKWKGRADVEVEWTFADLVEGRLGTK